MARSLSKIIVGMQPCLERAMRAWAVRDPELKLIPVPLTQALSYNFDYTPLADFDPKAITAFIAFEDVFLNQKRRELFQYMKQAGFSMPSLVHPQSIVDATAVIEENVWVGQGALIGADVTIGNNTVIAAGSAIHACSKIGAHVTIHENAKIAANCILDDFVSLGANVILQPGTVIGRSSRLTKITAYKGSYKQGTFIEDRFEAVILP